MRDLFGLVAVFGVLLMLSRGPSAVPAFAQAEVRKPASTSDADNSALWQTQNMLRSPTLRHEVIEADPAAKNVDQGVRQIMGSDENSAKLYDVSADVLSEVVDMSGGDPEKMQSLLNQAKANPEGFYNSLSDKQKAKIRSLANDASQNKPVNH